MMLRTALFIAFASLALGADLEQRIAVAMAKAPGFVGVHVVDLATGKVVYARNANQLFLPASNMKLFTAALAFERLGSAAQFTTHFLRDEDGSLVLQGGGDPSLSGRVYPYSTTATPPATLHAIDDLADQAVAAGLMRIDGNIVGDDRRYPWSPYPESWTADDSVHDYGAPVSALTLNDNFVTIAIRPSARPGELARIELDPGFEYFIIDNRIATGTKDDISITRVPGTRQLLMTGSINTRTSVSRQLVAVDDPALFAAHAMYDALLRRGVTIRGRPIARHYNAMPATTQPQILASRLSPPVSGIVEAMLKVSQNLHAEMLLREVGFVRQGQGTVAAGLREMEAMLAQFQIAASDFRSEDGSGLARNDMVSPRALTTLLAAMDSKYGAGWRSLLPVSGEGTLNNRLCCVGETVSIRAKTGSLNRAIALSGYADSPANGRLAFSILVNNFAAQSAEVRAWVDSLATILIQ